MKAQIIEKHGKKEFAVIPYKEFLRMQEALEDYYDLCDLRRAKKDPKNQEGHSFNTVAKELGLRKKKRSG
jgi:PHD/YefM family antitoxin component YafN of YafNO toxin-antitoxin module